MPPKDEKWILFRSEKPGPLGWWQSLFGRKVRPLRLGEVSAIRPSRPAAQGEWLIHLLIPLSDAHVGRAPERDAISNFEDQVDHILGQGTTGSYDGHEIGRGVYNVIFRCLDPFLLASELRPLVDLDWVKGEIDVQLQDGDKGMRKSSPEVKNVLLERGSKA